MQRWTSHFIFFACAFPVDVLYWTGEEVRMNEQKIYESRLLCARFNGKSA